MKKSEEQEKSTRFKVHQSIKKTIVILGIIFFSVFFIGTVSSFEFDNVMNYDEETRTADIRNSILGIPFLQLDRIAEVQLITPHIVRTSSGYHKIAEFEVRVYQNYSDALKVIEFYDLREFGNRFLRSYDYKYKIYEDVIVDDYGCDFSINGSCNYVKIGEHTEKKEKWIILPIEFKENENFTVGIFVNVTSGDYVEWIPNFFGVRITEWAILSGENFWFDDFATNTTDNYTGWGLTWRSATEDMQVGTTGSSERGKLFINNTSPINFTQPINIIMNFFTNPTGFNAVLFDMNKAGTSSSTGFIGTVGRGYIVGVGDSWTNLVLFETVAGFNDRVEIGRDSGYTLLGDTNYTILIEHNSTSIFILLKTSDDDVARATINSTDTNHSYGFVGWYSWDDFGVITELSVNFALAPIITLNSPIDNFNTLNSTIEFNGSVVSSDGIINVTLFIDGILNETNSSGINDTDYLFTKIIADGNYNWTYESCNVNGCKTATTRTFSIVDFIENSFTAENFTFETKTEEFIINITTNSSTPSNAIFIYNGTDKGGATITSLGNNNFNLSQTIDIPIGIGNNSWFFNFTLDGELQSSTSHQQRVSGINLTVCQSAPQNIPYINFSFKNETVNQEDVDASIPTSSWTYFLGTGIVNKSFSYANSTESLNYTFCFNPSNQTLSTTLEIAYTNNQSQQRIFSSVFSTLTNVTTQQTLYLLPTILGLFTQFATQDTLGNTLIDVLGIITRTLGGSTITATSDTTDGSGLVVFFLNPDVTYTGTFSKTGFVTNTFTFVPITDLRTVIMGSTTTTTVNGSTISLGTSFEIEPSNSSLNNNTVVTFSFNVTSPSTITLISMNITNSTTQRLFVNNSGQGFISGTLNTNNNTKLFGEFIIQTSNETITIKRVWFVGIEFVGNYSLFRQLTLFNDYGFDEFIKFLIVLSTIVGLLIFMSGENQIEDEIKMAVITLVIWGFSIVSWLDTGVVISSSSTNINALTQFSNQYGIAILTTAGTTYFMLRRIFREL